MPYDFLPKLNTLFDDGSFINLTKLSLEFVFEFPELTLTIVPSLESLSLYCCGYERDSNPILVIPDNFPLKRLTFWEYGHNLE